MGLNKFNSPQAIVFDRFFLENGQEKNHDNLVNPV